MTPFKGDTAVVTVVDADSASRFRMVLAAADGTESYRGVPPTGAWLLDLSLG